MDFKKKVAEFVDCFKNIPNFDFLGRLKTIVKDISGLIALAGATLMLIGAFVPNFHVTAGVSFFGYGVAYTEYANLFQAGGWYVFVLTLFALGLAYFKQTFWAGATAALALTITVIIAIAFPASQSVSFLGYSLSPMPTVAVGWFFLLFGELAVIGAFVLEEFVFGKKAAAPVAPVAEAPVVTDNTNAQ